ncbi:MAG: (4Fe-4S)-binding protein [candidate division WS1 bacterium]|jgi:ferredoxin|nr:(4Fe-4S)-binding protein [candidate division WS1 bacterium]
MLTAEKVKQAAKAMGADLCSIGTPDRWEGAPAQMDPRFIMPEAKSVIAFGFRIMRGSLRGIEEGTFFSNYSSMGYGGLNWLYIPHTMINMAKYIEDYGYEAIPLGHLSPWRAIDNVGNLKGGSRPVEPGKPAPDVMVHLRIAGFLCGMGEIGWSKVFLTPEFGPRQRIGVMLTEAELEPDPIFEPHLCDRCMLCASECPGAISAERSVKATIGGYDLEWNDLDCDRCRDAFRGGEYAEEGEKGEYMSHVGQEGIKPSPITPFYRRPNKVYEHGEAICGGKGCIRACMIHLESQGKIGNKFKTPFRRKKLWSVDWSQPDPLQIAGE